MKLLIVGLVASVATTSPAAESPETLLKKVFSGPKLAYSSSQTTRVKTDSGIVSGEVRLLADGKGASRREAGVGRSMLVLLQRGSSSWQFSGGAWTRLADSPSLAPAEAAKKVCSNYKVTAVQGGILLGRKTTQIVIAARYPYNPSRRIWLDPATGIVLRDILYAPDGGLRSETSTGSLAIGGQPAELFAVPEDVSFGQAKGVFSFVSTGKSEMERQTGRSAPLLDYCPHGYTLVGFGYMKTGSGFSMPCVRYSDGLSSFTVFQRGRAQGKQRGRGFGRPEWAGGGGGRGFDLKSDAQRSVVTVDRASGSYVLMGDLAESELAKVGSGIK
jgi:negative regulator of sigma E activity